ncbi:MAG: hypothetical protein ACOX1W_00960 [Catenisphaera adipataccumulans]|jgi:DNA-binding MarR family transcriptional regulator|uniref:hypothetical protein n=1 Tax=Catenisphaera adipataccumulans TaxID=700500 RepID=UPI003D8F2938
MTDLANQQSVSSTAENMVKNGDGKIDRKDIDILLNEYIFRKYRLARDEVSQLTHGITIREYVALYIMKNQKDTDEIYDGRMYLQDLVDTMQIPMRKASQMVNDLKERGAVAWEYDGDGSEGTYVVITESGEKLLEEREKQLNVFYGDVIKEFGKENMIQLLHLMRRMDVIVNTEFKKMEEAHE